MVENNRIAKLDDRQSEKQSKDEREKVAFGKATRRASNGNLHTLNLSNPNFSAGCIRVPQFFFRLHSGGLPTATLL